MNKFLMSSTLDKVWKAHADFGFDVIFEWLRYKYVFCEWWADVVDLSIAIKLARVNQEYEIRNKKQSTWEPFYKCPSSRRMFPYTYNGQIFNRSCSSSYDIRSFRATKTIESKLYRLLYYPRSFRYFVVCLYSRPTSLRRCTKITRTTIARDLPVGPVWCIRHILSQANKQFYGFNRQIASRKSGHRYEKLPNH